MKAISVHNPALDPACSVVVEACAGSGKTWLLASRIVRLLLAGVAPGEILAITFTRKAAAEIHTRVTGWLRDLAGFSDMEIDAFLAERGLAVVDDGDSTGSASASVLRRRARLLFEQMTDAQPGLAVHTFHAWFLQLVRAAPLKSGLSGVTLMNDPERRFDEIWQQFAGMINLTSPLGKAWLFCLENLGETKTKRLARLLHEQRADWLAYTNADANAGDDEGGEPSSNRAVALALERLRADLGVDATGDPLDIFFADGWQADFQGYADLLAASELPVEVNARAEIESALRETNRPLAFDRLYLAILTQKGEARAALSKLTGAMEKRLGAANAQKSVERHAALCLRLQAARRQQNEAAIYRLNQHGLTVATAFLDRWEMNKAAHGLIDFVDAEWRVLQLLRHEESAAFVQARLDARYKHILLDEFQDTNPLQWQILRAWLEAYGGAGSRPGIFLVGDPKQSIYRFRRAEARLFATAAQFLRDEFSAVRIDQNATRRNARPIVDVINMLFSAQPAFQPFLPQTSLVPAEVPGCVEVVPLFAIDNDDNQESETGKWPEPPAADISSPSSVSPPFSLRNPLLEAAREDFNAGEQNREAEAACLAERIHAMVGQVLIENSNGGPQHSLRPLRYSDIMILCRARTYLPVYERALRTQGIPYTAASRGGLMETLEAQDIAALIRFLATPADTLALLQTLRSPIFSCSNDDLVRLALRDKTALQLATPGPATPEPVPETMAATGTVTAAETDHSSSWLQRLRESAGEEDCPATLQRAAAMLGDWLYWTAYLPTHDLLDRIYHQGDVLARYRASVPAAMAAAVEANLLALLRLALDLDGGRYPSLPRFIAEIELRSRLSGDEALDEGEIENNDGESDAVPGLPNRVRLLTIHAAKGLEAPLVWLIDANNQGRPGRSPSLLVHWPPENAAPDHLSFYDGKETQGEARATFFAEEAALDEREALNVLYVAMTRARQMLVVSGIKGRARGQDSRSPHALVSSALIQLGNTDTDSGTTNGENLIHGQPLPTVAAVETVAAITIAGETSEVPGSSFLQQTTSPPVESSPPTPRLIAPIGERHRRPDAAARFGILLHALLERKTEGQTFDPLSDLDFDFRQANDFSETEIRAALPLAQRLLQAPGLQPFFDPAIYLAAWNELEIGSAEGAIFRLDRLVELDDAYWVIDYKSSNADTERMHEYHEQVRNYCAIVNQLFTAKPVRGGIIFADAQLVEVV